MINDNTLLQRIKSRMPPLPIWRTAIKSSVAVFITLIFVFVNKTRIAMGPANTLATLGSLLYFPAKPIGSYLKITLQGVLSATIGSAWCVLGNYVANLARDPNVSSPVQPASSAVSGVFCAIMVFVIAYVREKYPQMFFSTIFAGMIGSFALTQNAGTPGFQPGVTTVTFLMPVLFASAISLMVNWFLWPEDSVTCFLDTLNQAVRGYSDFFQDVTDAYCKNQAGSLRSRSDLRSRLQKNLIKLVDSQHDIEFTVLLSRFSQDDLSIMTQKIKEMRTPLHGIGLGVLCKNEKTKTSRDATKELDLSEYGLTKATDALVEVCKTALAECMARVDSFADPPRTWKSTLLWPFPRLYVKRRPVRHCLVTSDKMERAIRAYETESRPCGAVMVKQDDLTRQVVYLFQFNLVGFAYSLQSFLSFIERLDVTRSHRKRLWLPRVSVKKWFKPSISNKSQFGAQVNTRMSLAESSLYRNPSFQSKDSELGLNATTLTPKTRDDYVCAMNRNDRPCPRDPDVDAPSTFSEKCFNVLSKFVDWLYSMESVFAFKTTAGFMLLSIPAYLPQSVGWFTGWGGQWVANTLLMWMIPMAGMFNFTLLFGLIGTVIGAVFSIAIWEISRGNPYGLAILSFVAITPFHYLALKNEVFNFLSIMMSYMYLMIVTTAYQTAVGEDLQDNIIELAAGKRLIFVTLGIICSFLINLIPRPVTGRVELRRRIACTLSDMSLLHGIIFADILMDSSPESSNQKGTTMNQTRAFRQLTLHVQRQLKDEETYLRLSRYEPPLKGKFPHATYQTLIDKLNTMADLIEGMAYTSRNMDRSWRKRLMRALNEDKIDYVACLTTNMRHLSAALRAKMPLPPYMISPNDLKEKLAGIFSSAISSYPEEADNESLPNFCAYSAASYLFIQEFNEASECIEKLLGVEDPQKWLLMHM